MSYCRLSEPFFTQHETGHITAHWPDPTQESYEVAHEIVHQFVNTHNAMVDLKRWKGEALHLLAALDRCHYLLPEGSQAPPGGSKADAVENYLKRGANHQASTPADDDGVDSIGAVVRRVVDAAQDVVDEWHFYSDVDGRCDGHLASDGVADALMAAVAELRADTRKVAP